MTRRAELHRTTAETDVRLTLVLDGQGGGERRTGIGFFDHMLDLLAAHAGWDLEVEAGGDLQTGSHHTVEDTGLVLGAALHEALGDRAGIRRYGQAVIPMDEARAAAVVDLSGRPLLVFEAALPPGSTGGFEHELLEEFLRALAATARMTLHMTVETGSNVHHIIEACFKALARALAQAHSIDPGRPGVPSTKGTLTS